MFCPEVPFISAEGFPFKLYKRGRKHPLSANRPALSYMNFLGNSMQINEFALK